MDISIVFFVALMVVVIPGAFILIGLLARRGSGGDGAMACGQCGYPVEGLTRMHCPECGADLREVGIVRQSRQARGATGFALTIALAITGLFLLLGFLWAFNSAPAPAPPPPPTPHPIPSTPATP